MIVNNRDDGKDDDDDVAKNEGDDDDNKALSSLFVVTFRRVVTPKKVLTNQRRERHFPRVRDIVRPIRGHELCFLTAADFPPLVSFSAVARFIHSLNEKICFEESCCWTKKSFSFPKVI